MNKAQKTFAAFIVLFLAAFTTRGVLSRARAPVPAAPAKIRLAVQIAPRFEGKPLVLDDVRLRTRAGSLYSVSRLSFLVSNVALLRADGSRLALPEVAWLDAATDRTTFALADVPEGTYAGIAFRVGLDRATNHADPTRYGPGDPLNPALDHLHWGWQGGYVFFAIEGRYEQPGNRLGGYSYHLATDADPMLVTLKSPFRAAPGRRLEMGFDVAKVFDAVHPVVMRADDGSDSSHSAPGDPIAAKLKANVAQAFTFGGVSIMTARASIPIAPLVAAPPSGTTPFTLPIPVGFPQPTLPTDNPLTAEGIALGKRLFFDTRLSGNDRQSCASCHREAAAFSDPGKARSRGVDNQPGRRNAMALFNLAWANSYTWDGRRARLRDQALSPIQDTREMHQSLPQTCRKLAADNRYPALFARAFGSPGITSERVGLAIEQYLLTILSSDSKFDRALRREATYTDQEKQGLFLFITEYNPARNQFGADCFHCHGGNLFTDYQYKNNGVYDAYDIGRAVVTGHAGDRGKFKTPSLRNVELTGPYMHDGRFKTLEEVVEHYNSGVHRSDTLDPNLAKHPDTGLHLSTSDKAALVAFLKTLTDERYRPKGLRRK